MPGHDASCKASWRPCFRVASFTKYEKANEFLVLYMSRLMNSEVKQERLWKSQGGGPGGKKKSKVEIISKHYLTPWFRFCTRFFLKRWSSPSILSLNFLKSAIEPPPKRCDVRGSPLYSAFVHPLQYKQIKLQPSPPWRSFIIYSWKKKYFSTRAR